MGKIKKWYRSIPIWLALFLYVAAALLIASFLSGKSVELAYQKAGMIQAKYMTCSFTDETGTDDNGVTYQIITEDGIISEQKPQSVIMNMNFEKYTAKEMKQYQMFRLIGRYAPAFWYIALILTAGLLFYFSKLRKPLKMLWKATDQITENELDFHVDYFGYDEMAKLCAAFEKMRTALDENNRQMLRMIDERKQLNDAYTHDLRTPIAVLKGYTDMLIKYLPVGKMSQEEVLETVCTMSNHVYRLEQFVDSMNTVQKLEDVEIRREEVDTGEFLARLRETAGILCQSSGLDCRFESSVSTQTLYLDPGAIIQVCENMMSNAIRFARSKVMIQCSYKENDFAVSVSDDGKGFSDRDLLKADKPYYSGEAQKQQCHFGLGLHICRTLCEKHGGRLCMENAAQGGAKITARFSTQNKMFSN